MEKFAAALKTLGHIDRLRIIALLKHGELTVTELVQILRLSQPRVTQYIKTLEAVDLIERLKEGSWVFSRLKRGNPELTQLMTTVLNLLPEKDAVLAEDKNNLKDVRRFRSKVADAFFAKVANDASQLGDEYLPQKEIEAALISALGRDQFDFMIDMGTGTGRMLELFSSFIERGAGLDMNPEMLKVARHKLAADEFAHISVQQGDLQATPFRDESADLITLHQVLHYLDDPEAAIFEAARLLKPNGMLLVIDFEAHELERYRDDYAHRRLGFSDADIEAWSSNANLSCETVKRLNNKENPAIVIWKVQKKS